MGPEGRCRSSARWVLGGAEQSEVCDKGGLRCDDDSVFQGEALEGADLKNLFFDDLDLMTCGYAGEERDDLVRYRKHSEGVGLEETKVVKAGERARAAAVV
jgi:hypothetical protein